MATKRMLVDATHPEETRIVVTTGNRLEEFDFESAERRQLRGNIYLAKVTRVEPSLQAAFVEYGGNRHGFLAFSEIHPDYYQIPVADREALMRDEEEAHEEEADLADDDETDATESDDDAAEDNGDDLDTPRETKKVEQIGEGDALEDLQERPRRNQRRYKIQEVIKRRQVLLVQVVKEERGNKGAALTTYLSLAGRYSVLMPNTARGGGISRKITSAADRKRLKEIATDLEVPQGMGVILRTAGASRTKAEVKRDFEYLMRLWENVRTLTLESSAPCLVYEEGSLIKRTIRDLYNKDISEVLVSGEAGYREAKDFMRMIMPSHSKNVQIYKDDAPIFSRFNVESQLDSMFHPQVTLPSGGYIVINPTEALVSIDVNSGRATKEHNIEDTALQTNLEAAEEISRQLRLRDLAGLIVIDFIDMEERRNNRAVEKKLKDCLKNDRARIQVGHISHFGLMEMSRQRIRFGVLESSTHTCPTCAGTGLVRSVSSLALMIMRAIEDHVLRKPGQSINVNMPAEVALYILNTKRETLTALEAKYGLSITISAQSGLVGSQFNIERGEARAPVAAAPVQHIRADAASLDDYQEPEVEEEAEAETEIAAEDETGGERDGNRNKRRRRRRRGGKDNAAIQATEVATPDAESGDTEDEPRADAANEDDDDQPRKRRRRGRRGGRRNKRPNEGFGTDQDSDAPGDADAMNAVEDREPAVASQVEDAPAPDAAPETEVVAEAAEEKPKKRRTRKTTKAKAAEPDSVAQEAVEGAEEAPAAEPAPAPEKPARKPRAPRKKKVEAEAPAQEKPAEAPQQEKASEPVAADAQPEAAAEDKSAARKKKAVPSDEILVSSTSETTEEKPKKAGWWQRRLGLG
ncbi:Rne/Rng family ribonuclease [Pelagibacterium halotolerans]|uniref:Ribonuclease E n=1 Tax=Pelagibacterium halotolerans (strain DSM 22347 / JCM 15775 / CGMCC 1.7692 / B2) TaxID=1082931 RepID=G4RAL2_PELHB|nr:ribonuclease E/G [Pelagibacterium halotolerans]AEQ51565.1 cytoplasmic axial filament protein CafA and ribonuclease G [Pelagibacterium halotolerans B2]QJR18604.1 ribonuclease E/G [Pelagibacterium halotolerans]SEA17067.1 RNAse E [Pelagibacterium halotolerans]